MRIVSFGEILLRLAAPGYSRLFQKDNFDATFCGGEANVAVSLAVFGLDSAFVTKVPSTDVGRAAVNSLRYFGVDTKEVIFGQGRLGIYYLEKGASQRTSKVIYDREYSAIAQASRYEFDWERIFKSADWFHWTGINPALSENMSEICIDACEVAKKEGLIVSCDLNYRGKFWTPEKAQSIMPQLMKYVDVCICNEEDAEKALGIKTPDTDIENGKLSDAGYSYTAEMINRYYGCKYVAITLRKSYSASRNGWRAMLYDADASETCFSQEYDIQIVDRLGGGDSFAAGLIYALTTGMNNQEAINFAVAASCLKHTMEGDYNRATIEEIWNLVISGGNGRVQR